MDKKSINDHSSRSDYIIFDDLNIVLSRGEGKIFDDKICFLVLPFISELSNSPTHVCYINDKNGYFIQSGQIWKTRHQENFKLTWKTPSLKFNLIRSYQDGRTFLIKKFFSN